MDYARYDNDTNEDDGDYSEFVEWLSVLTAAALREAKPDPVRQKQALCCYYKQGERANLTAGELIDFLGVSSPSILDRAGYTSEEGDAVMRISDSLTDEDLRQTALPGAA